MRKLVLAAALMLAAFNNTNAQTNQNAPKVTYEYLQISAIESVVPGGLGRSRIVTTDPKGQVVEKDLKNFYSMVGINFGNIGNNDEVIVDKLNEISEMGWELFTVTSTSNQQSSGGSSSGGIFITRYLFRRAK